MKVQMKVKPRITYRSGWWYCWTDVPDWNIGMGKTPYSAYMDWQYR